MPDWVCFFSAFAIAAIVTYIFIRIIPKCPCQCLQQMEMYVKGFGDGEKFGKETAELDKRFDESKIYRD